MSVDFFIGKRDFWAVVLSCRYLFRLGCFGLGWTGWPFGSCYRGFLSDCCLSGSCWSSDRFLNTLNSSFSCYTIWGSSCCCRCSWCCCCSSCFDLSDRSLRLLELLHLLFEVGLALLNFCLMISFQVLMLFYISELSRCLSWCDILFHWVSWLSQAASLWLGWDWWSFVSLWLWNSLITWRGILIVWCRLSWNWLLLRSSLVCWGNSLIVCCSLCWSWLLLGSSLVCWRSILIAWSRLSWNRRIVRFNCRLNWLGCSHTCLWCIFLQTRLLLHATNLWFLHWFLRRRWLVCLGCFLFTFGVWCDWFRWCDFLHF